MNDRRNDLLLAALARGGVPMTSDQVLDGAMGLAEAEGWEPHQLAALNRRSVATRLRNLEAQGTVLGAGQAFDEAARRMTPTYTPADGFNAKAAVPPPPAEPATTRRGAPERNHYEGLDRMQLVAVLDAQDAMMVELARQAQEAVAFIHRLDALREKVRARLVAAGVEV